MSTSRDPVKTSGVGRRSRWGSIAIWLRTIRPCKSLVVVLLIISLTWPSASAHKIWNSCFFLWFNSCIWKGAAVDGEFRPVGHVQTAARQSDHSPPNLRTPLHRRPVSRRRDTGPARPIGRADDLWSSASVQQEQHQANISCPTESHCSPEGQKAGQWCD